MRFTRTEVGNLKLEIPDAPHAFVSFNSPQLLAERMRGPEGVGLMMFHSMFASMGMQLHRKGETALVVKTPHGKNRYFILNGDFRGEYEDAVHALGLAGALEVWDRHKEKHASEMSDSVVSFDDEEDDT